MTVHSNSGIYWRNESAAASSYMGGTSWYSILYHKT